MTDKNELYRKGCFNFLELNQNYWEEFPPGLLECCPFFWGEQEKLKIKLKIYIWYSYCETEPNDGRQYSPSYDVSTE